MMCLFPRVHPDHNDNGGVSAACCHDSHTGGETVDNLIRLVRYGLWVGPVFNFLFLVYSADE